MLKREDYVRHELDCILATAGTGLVDDNGGYVFSEFLARLCLTLPPEKVELILLNFLKFYFILSYFSFLGVGFFT